jgi:hypothetical protein
VFEVPNFLGGLPRLPVARYASVRIIPIQEGTCSMRTMYLMLAGLLISFTGARADCTSEVNDAFAKLRKSASFRMETKINNSAGMLTMSNDYVLPDRMHQSVSMESGAPGKMEMILVAGKAWSNQANAGWAEVPADFASKIAEQMKETVADPPKDDSKFECLGDVAFEGKTYAAYSTKRESKADDIKIGQPPAAANVQTVYIDKALGIPVRNIVTSANDPNKRLFDGTFSLLQDLKIEPPKL